MTDTTNAVDTVFPPFVPRFPWWGGFLQTARTHLKDVSEEKLKPFPRKPLELPTNDGSGDVLTADLLRPANENDVKPWPLIVLLHGLGGESRSSYIRSCAHTLLSEGYSVVRLNFRGAGTSAERCEFIHHPGRIEDLKTFFNNVQSESRYGEVIEHGVLLVGFSLGGSVLLKFLAHQKKDVPIIGAVCISAPLDLAASSRLLGTISRRPIRKYLLRRMKKEMLRDNASLTKGERRAIRNAKTIWQFDEEFTAPHLSFDSVEDYYRENSARYCLQDIDVKTLMIYAEDDPMIACEDYRQVDWQRNANLWPLITPSGGHVGYHGVGSNIQWHERCIGPFVRTLHRS